MQVRAGRERRQGGGYSEIPAVSAMASAYITSFASRVSHVLRALL
jgi:hypothetical protein